MSLVKVLSILFILKKKQLLIHWFLRNIYYCRETWRQPKCPLIEYWVKKMWYMYTMERYSAVSKDEVLPFATTEMHLENSRLSKINLSEKAKNLIILLICGIWNWNSYTQTDNSMVVTRGRAGGSSKGKGDQIYGDGRDDLILGGGHTVQYTDHVSYLKPIWPYEPMPPQ